MRKIIFPLCAMLILLLDACAPSSQSTSPASAKAFAIEGDFFMLFKGRIGEIPITVEMNRKDTTIHGRMYYDKIKTPMLIFGTIDSSGAIQFDEFQEPGKSSGHYEGRFISSYQIEGMWKNPTKGGEPLKFNLSQTSSGVERCHFTEFQESDCTINSGEEYFGIEHGDSICSGFGVSMLEVKTPNADVSTRINATLLQKLCESNLCQNFLDSVPDNCSLAEIQAEAKRSVVMTEDSFPISAEFSTSVRSCVDDILCVEILDGYETPENPRGGEVFYSYLNFDLKTGLVLKIEDYFNGSEIKSLNTIVRSKLIIEHFDENEMRDIEFKELITPQSSNFVIDVNGLYLPFQNLVVTDYVLPYYEVFLSYDEISSIVGRAINFNSKK